MYEAICDGNSAYLTIEVNNVMIFDGNINDEYMRYFDEDDGCIHLNKMYGSFCDMIIPTPSDLGDVEIGRDENGICTYSYVIDGVTYVWTA